MHPSSCALTKHRLGLYAMPEEPNWACFDVFEGKISSVTAGKPEDLWRDHHPVYKIVIPVPEGKNFIVPEGTTFVLLKRLGKGANGYVPRDKRSVRDCGDIPFSFILTQPVHPGSICLI